MARKTPAPGASSCPGATRMMSTRAIHCELFVLLVNDICFSHDGASIYTGSGGRDVGNGEKKVCNCVKASIPL